MSIRLTNTDTGSTVYAIVTRLSDGFRADVNTDLAFETHADGDISDYAISCPEKGTSGDYELSIPAWITAGEYDVAFYLQDGVSPAWTDSLLDAGIISLYSASTYITEKTLSDQIDGVQTDVTDISSSVSTISSEIPTTSGVATQVVSDLESAHGAGSWQSSAATGSNIVNVTTKDTGGNLLPNTYIEVRASGSTTLTDLKTSNGSTAKSVFNLDPGAYDFYTYGPGVATWTNPYSVLIDSSPQSFDLVGTRLTIPSPANGDLVTIYAYAADLGLDKQSDVEMSITPSGNVGSNLTIVQKPLSALSDSVGLVSLDVSSSTPMRVMVPKAKFDKYFVSPASGSINILDIP